MLNGQQYGNKYKQKRVVWQQKKCGDLHKLMINKYITNKGKIMNFLSEIPRNFTIFVS